MERFDCDDPHKVEEGFEHESKRKMPNGWIETKMETT
jgi:hypothetical protein